MLVAGDSGKLHTEIHPGAEIVAFPDAHCDKADVVRIRNNAYRTSTVERDVEFSRQIVQVAVVQDIMMQPFCEGTRVDQLIPALGRKRLLRKWGILHWKGRR